MIKPENIELVTQLEEAITGLNKHGWDFPFGTLLWEIDKQGEFSIEKLFDFEVIPENKIGFGHQQYLEPLLNLLHRNLIEFTIYNFSFSTPDASKVGFQESLITETNHPPIFTIDFEDLIIGKIQDNCWIGIIKTPNIPIVYVSKKQPFYNVRGSLLQEDKIELLTELENIFSVRYSNYLFEISASSEGVLEIIFDKTQIVCSQGFDAFEQRLKHEIEFNKEPTQNLSEVLHNNLIQVREYKVCNYYAYFIGQTHWGDWAGVWTQEF
ncbi:MAG: hypothetical protein KI793_30305 [Rivularia sp. (in: Bacteria)]|nr:hypothetical protein [Rivularia sp. MS3]